MKRLYAALILFCFPFLISANAFVRIPKQSTGTPLLLLGQATQLSTLEFQILQKINKVRIEHNLEPVMVNHRLMQITRSYSRHMAITKCFTHDCRGLNSNITEFTKTGKEVSRWTENLKAGNYPSNIVDDTVEAWLNSPYHLKNLLTPDVSETGIGVWVQGDRYYVTQTFIKLFDDVGTPPANLVKSPPANSTAKLQPRSRDEFERQIQKADPESAVSLIEDFWLRDFRSQLDPQNVTDAAKQVSPEEISNQLSRLENSSGVSAAIIYLVSLKDELHLYFLPPNIEAARMSKPTQVAIADFRPGLLAKSRRTKLIDQVVLPIPRADLIQTVKRLRQTITDVRERNSTRYLQPAQQLHAWLIAPFAEQLKARKIKTLIFAVDQDLRSIPFAALHDGDNFLIEQYNLALIPSFGLTNTHSEKLKDQPILAMGISESTEDQEPLPGVSLEISSIPGDTWSNPTQRTLNATSTLDNFQAFLRGQSFGIVHLATHAGFYPGQIDNSFIQFWNHKLTFRQLGSLARLLQWNVKPSVELLVLSACQTAIGSREAELGFAGSAVQTGVKSTLASLWRIDDQATVGLMAGFYQNLRSARSKAGALRQAQIMMLNGSVRFENNQLVVSPDRKIPWREGDDASSSRPPIKFTHPYFWAPFTIVGNWN